MQHKQTTRRLIYSALPCAAALVLGARHADGQAAATPTPDKQYSDKQLLDKQHITLHIKQKKLTQVVSLLSEAIGRGIVVDDEPSELLIDVDVMGTGRDALDAFAAACDYSWSLNRRGLVLMRKAFQKPTTLPQMNLPEMRQMAQDAIDAFSAFPCAPRKMTPLHGGAFAFSTDPNGMDWDSQLRALARSFTAAQREQLRAGKILHTADLSQKQENTLQQVVVSHAFSDLLGGWMSLFDALEQLPAVSLEMRAATERRRGIDIKGIALEQVRQGSDGREIRTRLAFVPEEKKL